MMPNKKAGLIALLVALAASDLWAGTLTSYSVGDVLVCFRKSGAANDLVVDAGPVSTFTNATANQRISITQFTTNQLYTIGLNSVIWSAFTWFDDSVSPTNIQWTLFATRPRSSLNTQTAAWPQQRQAAQANVGGDMGNIVLGAATIYNISPAYSALSTTAATLEPDDTGNSNPDYTSGQSYSGTILTQGATPANFNGDSVCLPENTVGNTFASAGTVARSDFFQIPPSDSQAGSAKFLGYFELNTNGLLTYVAYPSVTPTTPVITAVSRASTTTSVSFTTGTSGTYTLRGTNSTGLVSAVARTNWPVISSTTGTGSVKTLTDTTSDPNKFYVITAQ